jgi:hypothetical protein
MALTRGGSTIDVGWVRRAVCAVTHRMCRQALIKKCVVLLRNAWWVTQKALTHPTFRLTVSAIRVRIQKTERGRQATRFGGRNWVYFA